MRLLTAGSLVRVQLGEPVKKPVFRAFLLSETLQCKKETFTLLYTVDDIKRIVEPFAKEYGVKKLSVFGSYARGEATENSDIDFHLIDTKEQWGYFTLCGFNQDLEERLGVNVDVLTTGAMNNEVLERVTRDEVIIFE